MGTRSLTKVYDEWTNKPIVSIYQQFDGYPTGVGMDLANLLKGVKIINGISGQTMSEYANGMGCLAAQIIMELKSRSGIGGVYLYSADTTDVGEEYIYHIRKNDKGMVDISCENAYTQKIVFSGTPEQWIAEYKAKGEKAFAEEDEGY